MRATNTESVLFFHPQLTLIQIKCSARSSNSMVAAAAGIIRSTLNSKATQRFVHRPQRRRPSITPSFSASSEANATQHSSAQISSLFAFFFPLLQTRKIHILFC